MALALDLNGEKGIDGMREFYDTSTRIFVVHDFIGQDHRDLNMLANIKGSFSEQEIGKIATQLLKAVSILHHKDIVLRYLTP